MPDVLFPASVQVRLGGLYHYAHCGDTLSLNHSGTSLIGKHLSMACRERALFDARRGQPHQGLLEQPRKHLPTESARTSPKPDADALVDGRKCGLVGSSGHPTTGNAVYAE